jgi:phage host-nuclease inhibitor protein Gam
LNITKPSLVCATNNLNANRYIAMNAEQTQELQKREEPTEEHPNGGAEESGIVDRIRDILIGSQMRDYDGRLQRLDERLSKGTAEARAEAQKRFESLENSLKGEVESLSNRLNAEQSERRAAIEKLGHDLAETAKAFESKIKTLGDYAREIHDLHRELVEQSKSLSTEVKEKHEQMQAGLNRETEQIRGSMIGRQALAEILSEVALRIKNESRSAGA